MCCVFFFFLSQTNSEDFKLCLQIILKVNSAMLYMFCDYINTDVSGKVFGNRL